MLPKVNGPVETSNEVGQTAETIRTASEETLEDRSAERGVADAKRATPSSSSRTEAHGAVAQATPGSTRRDHAGARERRRRPGQTPPSQQADQLPQEQQPPQRGVLPASSEQRKRGQQRDTVIATTTTDTDNEVLRSDRESVQSDAATGLPSRVKPEPNEASTAVHDCAHPIRRPPPTPPRCKQSAESDEPPTVLVQAQSMPAAPHTPPAASALGDTLADMGASQDPLSPEDALPAAPELAMPLQTHTASPTDAVAPNRRPQTAPTYNPMHPTDSTLVSMAPGHDSTAYHALRSNAAASHEVAFLTHEMAQWTSACVNAGRDGPSAGEAGVELAADESTTVEAAAGGGRTVRSSSPGRSSRGAMHPATPAALPAALPAATPGGMYETTALTNAQEPRDTPAPRRRLSSGSSTSVTRGSCGAQLTPCCTNQARMPMLSPDGTQVWQQSPALVPAPGGARSANAVGSAGGTEISRRAAVPRAHETTPVGRLQLPDVERGTSEERARDTKAPAGVGACTVSSADGSVREARLPSCHTPSQPRASATRRDAERSTTLPKLCSGTAPDHAELSTANPTASEDAGMPARVIELLEAVALSRLCFGEEECNADGSAVELAQWHELELLCRLPAAAAIARSRYTTPTVLSRPVLAFLGETNFPAGVRTESTLAAACTALRTCKHLLAFDVASSATAAAPPPFEDILVPLEQVFSIGLSKACVWPSTWHGPLLSTALSVLAAPFECEKDTDQDARAPASPEAAAWLHGALVLLRASLPALLHDATLQAAALRCSRVLFGAAARAGEHSSADAVVGNAATPLHDALTLRIELARSMQAAAALRPLCDCLDAHPAATLAALSALVHTPVHSPDSDDDQTRVKDLCQAGHGLCCAMGQQLLALRPRAVSWLQAAPSATLRVLLHACRAQPALGASLATDDRLQTALWALATSTPANGAVASLSEIDVSEGSAEPAPIPVAETSPLLALLLLALLLAHGSQQTTQSTRSEAVQVALPHVPTLARLLVPPDTPESDALSNSDRAADIDLNATVRRQGCGAAAACANAAATCLSELLRTDGSATHALSALQAERGDGSLHRSVTWLEAFGESAYRIASEEALRAAEGTCFGFPYTRVADGFAALLQRLLLRLPRKHTHLALLSKPSFWRALASTLRAVSDVRIESPLLTPNGTLALIKASHEALSKLAESSAAKLLHSGLLAGLLGLLHGSSKDAVTTSPLGRLHGSPAARGGGAAAAAAFLNAVSLTLYVPFGSRGERSPQALVQLQQAMYSSELVGVILRTMPLAEPHETEVAVGLMSRLVLGSNHFAQQYVALGGLQPAVLRRMLSSQRAASTLTDALLILCQLARLGERLGGGGGQRHSAGGEPATEVSYVLHANTHGAALCERLPGLLRHADAGVRAKVCNLLGNMCKHSDEFYEVLVAGGLLSLLARCCADPDDAVRKFACFAIGNAGFHSAKLYSRLDTSVAPLVGCLDDADGKTRANAAGALGNLARNGPELCAELVARQVPRGLLALGLRALLPPINHDALAEQRVSIVGSDTCAAQGLNQAQP